MLGGCRLESLALEDATYLVFRAQHLGLKRPAAIRVLRPALAALPRAVEAFGRAARSQPGVLNIGFEGGIRFAEVSAKGEWPDLHDLSEA